MKKLSLLFILLAAGAGSALAQPKVIAHRGYWKAPNSAQNSLASFSKADSIGVFASEIDVWLTADDRLIVNHDRVFKGTDINMERSTQRDICNIVLANGENIPTLDAYLKLVTTKPDTRLVLEMKSLSDLSREDLAAEKSSRRCASTALSSGPTSSPSRSTPAWPSRSCCPIRKSTTSTATSRPRKSRSSVWPASTTRLRHCASIPNGSSRRTSWASRSTSGP